MIGYWQKIVSFNLFLLVILSIPLLTQAGTIDDLKTKIEERNRAIATLEKEIIGVKTEIDKTADASKSLQGYIKTLDLTLSKLDKDISITENRIAKTTYTIETLGLSITNAQQTITENRRVIAHLIRDITIEDSLTVPTTLLGAQSISQIWDVIENTKKVGERVRQKTVELGTVKNQLELNQKAQQDAKADLELYQRDLAARKIIFKANKQDKANILKETKNKESNYRKILESKEIQKEAFENELNAYEAELKIVVDASRLPKVGSGVLSWPLDSVKVTQYFGNTPFATKNPQIYSTRGHNGVDFRASVGTPIRSALHGVVAGTGNTDNFPGCYSYGKWILITHSNGLSTLYAHLSYVTVNQGDKVTTRQIIGYSGNTGYSTGPHLHFGVYASQGVQIITYSKSKNCYNAVMPIADPKAYLNPLSYL